MQDKSNRLYYTWSEIYIYIHSYLFILCLIYRVFVCACVCVLFNIYILLSKGQCLIDTHVVKENIHIYTLSCYIVSCHISISI